VVVAQAVKNFSDLQGTGRFVTAYASPCRELIPVHSKYLISIPSVLILFYHQSEGLPNFLFTFMKEFEKKVPLSL
jgi:hypothetical protein